MSENPYIMCKECGESVHARRCYGAHSDSFNNRDMSDAWQEGFEAGRQTLLEESIELARLARQLAAKEILDAPVTPPTRGGRATATVCTDCGGNKRIICECVPQIHEVEGVEEMVGAVDCQACQGDGDIFCPKCGGTGGVIEPPGVSE